MTDSAPESWSITQAAELYGLDRWGTPFFGLNRSGEVVVQADLPEGTGAVSLKELATGLRQRGHDLPVLLRIENLLDSRIRLLNTTFEKAIRELGYCGQYRGVFPIKVNQQAQVIEEICRFGQAFHHGLEAGSKAELLLALAHLPEDSLLILNGTKDRDYIDLGLWGQQLGLPVFFVIESPNELDLLLERSRTLEIEPQIGVRMKVSARVGGLWTETSGDRSSFGLSIQQILGVVETLTQANRLHCLTLLHCHLGSQIPHLNDIEAGVREASRVYADLARLGAPMGYLDLGGGLAVDYTGFRHNHVHSRDYDLPDYCRTLVRTVGQTLDDAAVEHPHLITESGRATVAHTSVLIFDILDVMHFEPGNLPCPEEVPPSLHCLAERIARIDEEAPEDLIREAFICRDQLRQQHLQGQLSLAERGQAEDLFLALIQRLTQKLEGLTDPPKLLHDLKQRLSDIYYGNFSVFQSLPDTWAIDQIFPVMPLHRLDEQPTREGILADLTCDCDGKLDLFITGKGERASLPLHPLKTGEDYLLGVFLMGAYQETLGDLHNLFGDTHVVNIRITGDGEFDLLQEVEGDSVGEVLQSVEYDLKQLNNTFRSRAEAAVRKGQLSPSQRQTLVQAYQNGLQGYTYFKR